MSMSSRWFRLLMTIALLISAAALFSQASAMPGQKSSGASGWRERATAAGAGKYIVLTKPTTGDVSAARVSAAVSEAPGVTVTQTYSYALTGFAADLSAAAVKQLASDPRVEKIVPDGVVHAFSQLIPPGARRVGATTNSTAKIDGVDQRVNADIAILDMGVGPNSDLDIRGGTDCLNPGVTPVDYSDLGGHGTHVAGIAAAIDNSSGIVGVAPGARIWSVRVLPGSGDGFWSDVICGIEWVTAHSSTIEVANLSLGAQFDLSQPDQVDLDQTIHEAIQRSVAAGVTYVVAAGNNSADASTTAPAKYSEVITVSAFCDSDGKPGGLGPVASACTDDSFASFSNYGTVVDIAAPGVDTVSLAVGGGIDAADSGTSFSSPHVAGAAALYIAQFGRVGPSNVRAALLAAAEAGPIPGDPSSEGRLNVGAIVPGTVAMGHGGGPVGDRVTVKLSGFPVSAPVSISFDSITVCTTTTDAAGAVWCKITVPEASRGTHKITAISGASTGTARFAVTSSLSVNPSPASYGQTVNFTGRGFKPAEFVTVSASGPTPLTLGSAEANALGSVTVTLSTPAAIGGAYTATMTGDAGSAATRGFTISPSMALSSAAGVPGASVKISVRGFQSGETYSARYRNSVGTILMCSSKATAATGSSSCTGKIPSSATKGPRTIEVSGSKGTFVSLPFTVVAPSAAAVGSPTTTPTKTTTPKPTALASVSASATIPATANTTVTATPGAVVETSTPTVAPPATASETPTGAPTAVPTDAPTETATPTATDAPTETATETATVATTATDVVTASSPPAG